MHFCRNYYNSKIAVFSAIISVRSGAEYVQKSAVSIHFKLEILLISEGFIRLFNKSFAFENI